MPGPTWAALGQHKVGALAKPCPGERGAARFGVCQAQVRAQAPSSWGSNATKGLIH